MCEPRKMCVVYLVKKKCKRCYVEENDSFGMQWKFLNWMVASVLYLYSMIGCSYQSNKT